MGETYLFARIYRDIIEVGYVCISRYERRNGVRVRASFERESVVTRSRLKIEYKKVLYRVCV